MKKFTKWLDITKIALALMLIEGGCITGKFETAKYIYNMKN